MQDYNTTETVHLPFNTFSSNDPSQSVTATDLVAGDLRIYKDGGVTQRSSAAGVTISIDFDGDTGGHVAHIDLSDNTDAGFYADGSRYIVRAIGITVDAGTLNPWIGGFSIGCVLRPATAGRTLVVDADGLADANVVKSGPTGSGTAQTANDNGADINTVLSRVTAAVATASALSTHDGKLDTADALIDVLIQALILVDTTIESANRTTTSCQMATGPVEDDALIGCRVILVGDDGTGYVARTITDYAASNNVVTWAPAIAQDAVDGGNIYVIPGDTNVSILIGALNDLSAADVKSEADDALTGIHLDHLLAATYDPASKPGAADALLNELVENDGGVSRFTENALEEAPSGTGGDATEAKQDSIIAAVITNAAGADIAADIIEMKAETVLIVADTNELQSDDVPGLIGALNNVSTAEVNAQCDTALSDYDGPTKAEMDTGHGLLATEAKQDIIDTNVDTLLADWTNGGRLDLILDAVLAMLDDARGEPSQGALPVNPDAMTKLDYIYKRLRNKKEQTATEFDLYDDAGTTVDHKATVSDDGTTATFGEMVSGP